VFVCDQCGTDEALRAMAGNTLPLAEWNYAVALAELSEEKPSHDNLLWDTLLAHWGHDVRIVKYGNPDDPADVCLECVDCNEVILDAELYTLCAREDT